jgi:hypothetical protein
MEGTIAFAGLRAEEQEGRPRVDIMSTSFGFEFAVQTFNATYLLDCSSRASHVVE